MLSAILIYHEKAGRCLCPVQEFERNAMKHRVGEQYTFQAVTGSEYAALSDARMVCAASHQLDDVTRSLSANLDP
jgi:hypothetical protein